MTFHIDYIFVLVDLVQASLGGFVPLTKETSMAGHIQNPSLHLVRVFFYLLENASILLS